MKNQEDLRKRRLRRELLARRAAMTEEDIEDRSRIIAYRVIQSWEFQQARSLLLYAHFDHEVRTHELMAAAVSHGKRVILPRVNRERRELDLYFVEDFATQVAPGTWQIPEPVPELCEPASLDDVECVIAPGVGFDLSGGRLGYGGGYYDRLLNALTPAQARVAVGICFETQIVREVPRGFFDAAVSVVCTEVNLFDHR
jgi:5-formyltetrahydrofolate cyclo-ligase